MKHIHGLLVCDECKSMNWEYDKETDLFICHDCGYVRTGDSYE